MKIALDHQIFSLQKFGGISRYFASLHKASQKDLKHTLDLNLIFTENSYLDGNLNNLHLNNLKLPHRVKFYLNELYGISKLSTLNYDVYHPTYYHVHYFPKIPIVSTVYDTINEEFPHYFKGQERFLEYKKKLITKSSKIIAISQVTKNKIIDFYKISDKKISVIYINDPLENLEPQKNTNSNLAPYLLFVGTREGYKNFDFLIQHIAEYLLNNQIYLVCYGGNNFTKKEIENFKKLKVDHLVIHKSYFSDQDLKNHYANSLAFIFPSLQEGQGIPILEAMGSNCPMLLSDIPVFREVAQGHAQYFNPCNGENLISCLESLKKNSKIHTKDCDYYKSFNSEIMFNQTISFYQSI